MVCFCPCISPRNEDIVTFVEFDTRIRNDHHFGEMVQFLSSAYSLIIAVLPHFPKNKINMLFI